MPPLSRTNVSSVLIASILIGGMVMVWLGDLRMDYKIENAPFPWLKDKQQIVESIDEVKHDVIEIKATIDADSKQRKEDFEVLPRDVLNAVNELKKDMNHEKANR